MSAAAPQSRHGIAFYLAIFGLACVAFYVGRSTALPANRFAFAEKGQVVFEAMIDRPHLTEEEIQRQVRAPILGVLQRYADEGFVVIDVAKDRQGYMSVAAYPKTGLDITSELRAAVQAAAASGVQKPNRPATDANQ